MINMLVLQHIHPDCKLAKKHIDIDQGVLSTCVKTVKTIKGLVM